MIIDGYLINFELGEKIFIVEEDHYNKFEFKFRVTSFLVDRLVKLYNHHLIGFYSENYNVANFNVNTGKLLFAGNCFEDLDEAKEFASRMNAEDKIDWLNQKEKELSRAAGLLRNSGYIVEKKSNDN